MAVVAASPRRRAPRTSAAERLARRGRVKQLVDGTVRIPLACAFCFGSSLDRGELASEASCIKCGRTSKVTKLHTIRRQRIERFIRTGDV